MMESGVVIQGGDVPEKRFRLHSAVDAWVRDEIAVFHKLSLNQAAGKGTE